MAVRADITVSEVGTIAFAMVCLWAVVTAVVASTGPGQRWRVQKLESRVDRRVPEALEVTLRHRIAARLGWGALGTVLGAGTGLSVVAGPGAGSSPLLALAPVFGGALAGWSVAVCLVARAVRPPSAGAARVARARTTALADYLPAFQLWSALAVVVLCFAGLALVLAVDHGSSGERATASERVVLLVVPAAVTAVATGLAAVLAGAVLRAPQPAASPEGLAWDDVLRWRTLADLLDLPVGIGYVSVVTALTVLGGAPGGGVTAAFVVTQAILVLALAYSHLTVRTRPEPRLRRRLWASDLEEVAGAGR